MTVAAPAPLTRRQLRELERAAAGVESSVSLPTDGLDVLAPVVHRLPMGGTPSDQATAAMAVTLSRRDLRSDAHRTRAGRLAPRAAILSSLGAVTIAAPLTGFAATAPSAVAAGSVAPETSVLDTIDSAAAARALEGSGSTGAALQFNESAMARATELASRAQARTGVSACAPVEGASGMREAFTERQSVVYRPMVQGTYRDTSLYGPRWGSYHYGTDMAAAAGTPIYAVAPGEVIYAGGGKEGRSGQLVIIHHVIDGQDVWSWYGHMYTDGVYVSAGDQVQAGELIAGVGSNGFSTGPHLHFEIHVGEYGNHVNPLTWLSEAGAVFPGQC